MTHDKLAWTCNTSAPHSCSLAALILNIQSQLLRTCDRFRPMDQCRCIYDLWCRSSSRQRRYINQLPVKACACIRIYRLWKVEFENMKQKIAIVPWKWSLCYNTRSARNLRNSIYSILFNPNVPQLLDRKLWNPRRALQRFPRRFATMYLTWRRRMFVGLTYKR